eukprot:9048925-Pyramimonas_sp.AAC.1
MATPLEAPQSDEHQPLKSGAPKEEKDEHYKNAKSELAVAQQQYKLQWTIGENTSNIARLMFVYRRMIIAEKSVFEQRAW